jgi:MFS family permease
VGRRFGRARALALDVSPLRESVPYRALWAGQIVSLFGTQMRYVAVPFQVFQITRSTLAVGLIGLVEVVPLIVFSFVGGALADARDRRTIIAVAQVVLLADSVALALVSLEHRPSVVMIYVLTGIGGAVGAVDRPARGALVPELVNPNQLTAAMALRQVVFQVSQIAGPAAGGLLIGAFREVAWVYAIDAATFLASLVALWWVPRDTGSSEQSEATFGFHAVKEGLAFALRTPLITSIFVVDLVAMIFGMPRAVFPALAEETFGLGAAGLGFLYAAPAVGALLAALTTGWVKNVERQGMAVLIAVALWGMAITLAGLCLFSLALTLLFLALAGAADVVSAVFRGTMLLEASPEALRGRTQALNLMVVTGGPRLGDAEAGAVASLVGAGPSIVVGGVACLAGTGVVAAGFSSLRRYRAPHRTVASAPRLPGEEPE